MNTLHTKSRNIIKRTGQSGCCDIIRRTGFELERKVVERSLFERYIPNHFASTHIRRKPIKPGFLTIKHSDTRWSVNLMPAKGKEIAVYRLYIDRKMRCALCPVNQNRNIMSMSNLNNPFYRIYCTQHIAYMRYAHHTGMFIEHLFKFIETKFTFVRDRYNTQTNTFACLNQLPADDIRMMLHLTDDHLVALIQKSVAKSCSHEIDALCRTPGENNFGSTPCIQETTYGLPGRFVQLSSLLGQEMYTTVHIGIHIVIFLSHSLDHLTWFLSRSTIIQIYQRTTVYLAFQNREITPD